ncbi:hypothetical protein EGW08_005010 [Elysia chlorotica]|uniref:Mammalian ependymin-related protein 1 n=1 Tax=Elysia chlorotica TaxID=188477 RepID=A0A3S1AB56_ELYCH|nr:hypothetical protein EGW08_005010 [Elysia chlorotica]
MHWTSVALVLCSLAALGWTCCTPEQWEGEQTLFSGYTGFFQRGLIKEFNDVAYDYSNKRSAVFLRYINGDIEAKIKIVVRYDDNDDAGMLYVDNYNRGKCWKKRLDREFRKCCIPKDAKRLGEYSMGLKGKYNATSYEIKGKRMNFILTVQTLGEGVCAPIGQLAAGRVGHFDVVRNVGFINITPGIKNETVFDVPWDCKDDWSDFDLPIEIDRQDYILGV